MKSIKILLGLGVIGALAALAFLYSGIYSMGADEEHAKPVYWALQTLRERSIAVRSSDIQVPPLDDPQMLLDGGADYNDMCAGCHLKPGVPTSDMAIGLYPRPPNLAATSMTHGHDGGSHEDQRTAAARQFWIIKHGIKASGMPAWGRTHDDGRIWAMVAFLQKLPALDQAQYQILTARTEPVSGHSGHVQEGMRP